MTASNNQDSPHLEIRVSLVEREVKRLVNIIDGTGGGDVGLKQTVTDFVADWKGRERDKMKYDDRQSKKQTLIVALAVAILGLITFLGIKAHITF